MNNLNHGANLNTTKKCSPFSLLSLSRKAAIDIPLPEGNLRPPDTSQNNNHLTLTIPLSKNAIYNSNNSNENATNERNSQLSSTAQQLVKSNRTNSEPNLEILNRANGLPSQNNPTHQDSQHFMAPAKRSRDLQKSGLRLHGDNGIPVKPGTSYQRQIDPTNTTNTFPKVSSNFDKTSFIPKSSNISAQKNNAPPVRLNAPVNNNVAKHLPTVDGSKLNAPTPHAIKPTFASTLRAINEQNILRIDISPAKQTTKQGYPAVIFKREDYMVKLAERCKFTLIGKFESTMPRMELIRRSFEAQVQLKSKAKIAHFNSTHVYIDLENQLDHDTVWFKQTMWIQGRQMKLFKWTPTFKPGEETPIAPIWVELPELPWHLYYMEAMCELFKSIGRVISLDVATFQKTRGSVAKVKLEIDVTKIRPNYFWVGYDDDENGEGYWQEAQYEDVPSYCSYCKHQGHFVDVCSKKRRDDEMGKKKVEEIPIPVEATRQSFQNKTRDVRKQPPAIAGKPPAQKQHYIPKNHAIPISNGPNPSVNDTVMARMHPTTEENLGGCSGSKENDLTDVVKLYTSDVPKGHVADVVNHTLVASGVSGKNCVSSMGQEIKNAVIDCGVPAVEPHDIQPVKLGLNEWHSRNPFDVLAESVINSGPTLAVNNTATAKAGISMHTTAGLESAKKNLQVKPANQENFNMHNEFGCSVSEEKEAHNGNVPDSLPTGDVLKSDVACYRGVTLLFDSATTSTYKENDAMIKNPVVVPQKIADKSTSESTKDWILKSFYGSKQDADKSELLVAIEQHTGFFENAEQHRMMLSNNGQNAEKVQEKLTADMTQNATDLPCDVAPDIEFPNHPGKEKNAEVQHTPASNGKARGQKKKKKTDKNTVKPEELTEEDIRKAKIRAWQDAILAKSYAQFPPTGELVGGSMENKIAYSVPSQSNNVEQTETEAEKISPAQSGSTLTPTSKLEVICKRASKLMRETGRGFFPVTPREQSVNEGFEPETIFPGDLFDDSGKDQSIPSKIGKSKWNLNAPIFIPNALRQQESQVATDNVDSQKVPTLAFPNAPSDEVLLKNLDLHDIRGLLLRQNSPPQELPQKFSSAHPGIIEDGSEYEDEDEESTAYNYMEESRHAGLSPRLDQVRKPKLLKKKRRPLELKKKEEAPKEPKRVQPTRSSKSKSARANYAAKRL